MLIKNKILLCIVTFSFLFAVVSCNKSADKIVEKQGEVITTKIMYDVNVVNNLIGDRTRKNPDWFWENLPSPEGDAFLKKIYEDAVSGKEPIYYYDMMGSYDELTEIPDSKRKEFLKEELNFTTDIPEVYVEETGEYIPQRHVSVDLDYRYINKLRFLEEWQMSDGKIVKKVLAVAPIFTVAIPNMNPAEIGIAAFWMKPDTKLLKNNGR